jgi:hypothetical protein
MLHNTYASEKLRELEEERITRALVLRRALSAPEHRSRRPKRVIGPVIRAAGRTLRRAGEGLEGWATGGQPDAENRMHAERRTG